MLATQLAPTHTHSALMPSCSPLPSGGKKSQAALAAIINHFFFYSVIKVYKYT